MKTKPDNQPAEVPTPRVDDAMFQDEWQGIMVVSAYFARQLERENIALLAALRRLIEASKALQIGIEIHNQLNATCEARRDNIDGPVVTAFYESVHAARAAIKSATGEKT